MAKELSIKIKVDGQEIDVAKKSTKELNEQISGLRKKLEEVPIGSKDFKKIQGDIDALEKGFQKAKNATRPFLDNMAELPGIAGLAGQSMKGLKGAFDLLAANPLIAVFSLLAMIMLKVIDKLKEMDGVMDPLEKITKTFSGVLETLASVIMPPVAFLLEKIAEGAGAVANMFAKLIGSTNEVGDNMSYVADALDQLDDSAAAFAVSQAEANRQLQEAREIAGDSTKTITERVNALKHAADLERKIAKENRERELQAARARAIELATTLGYSQQQIDAIKKYDAARIKSFALEIQDLKALNREKSNALFQNLGTIEDISAQEAKIGKKTQSQITSLQREEQNKRVEAGKAAAAQTKDFESRLAGFQNDLRLNNIKDEQEKARVSLDIEKQKTLNEIASLEMSTARKNTLRLAAEKDYASKLKVLTDKQAEDNKKKNETSQKELETYFQKVREIEIAAYAEELQRNILTRENKFENDKKALLKDENFQKTSKERQTEILVSLEKAKNIDIQKLRDEDAKKNAELIYKQIEFERQSRVMMLQTKLQMIDNEYKNEVEKVQERRSVMDEQAKIDLDKEIENLDKLHNAKEVNDKDYNERRVQLQLQYDTKIAANSIKLEKDIKAARQANLAAVNQLADSIGQVAQAMGAETTAGRALIKVQQALALATTAVALAQAFQGLGKDLAKGFPTNIIAVASTLALIATAISQFKALTGSGISDGAEGAAASQGPAENSAASLGRNYGDGGYISGPSHANGGVPITAEGGEAVMTRGAVTMFAPLLSSLNQIGGGTSFAAGGIIGAARPDNPMVNNPAANQSPLIMKTYVVSSEMTSDQERQARLKDLSTL
jgi:hypothetical protein